jgi:transaldolase
MVLPRRRLGPIFGSGRLALAQKAQECAYSGALHPESRKPGIAPAENASPPDWQCECNEHNEGTSGSSVPFGRTTLRLALERSIMNPLLDLKKHGQSVWLDYIQRSLLTGGDFERLIEEDGVRGVTSNPTIFEKAIAGSGDYDGALRALLDKAPETDVRTLYDDVAIEDVRMAADLLRPAYDLSACTDGFVSLEPPPQLTRNTASTIAEVRRLWQAVNRPNLMIKVVATPEGVRAVEILIAEGININITLMFSLDHYEAVASAYIRGLQQCREPARVASVASFFVSRVDTQVDRALEEIGTADALALRGTIAIANAKMVYRRFSEIFYGAPFATLKQRGARVQRPLWASTGTKNPKYRDVLYVEDLIGLDTVTTIPPATLDAFRSHGRVRGATVTEGTDEAGAALSRLAGLGIDLQSIAEKLQIDGLAAFASGYDSVLAGLERKKQSILARQAV